MKLISIKGTGDMAQAAVHSDEDRHGVTLRACSGVGGLQRCLQGVLFAVLIFTELIMPYSREKTALHPIKALLERNELSAQQLMKAEALPYPLPLQQHRASTGLKRSVTITQGVLLKDPVFVSVGKTVGLLVCFFTGWLFSWRRRGKKVEGGKGAAGSQRCGFGFVISSPSTRSSSNPRPAAPELRRSLKVG